MTIKLKYEEGVFKPLSKINGINEGQVIELKIKDDMAEIAMAGGSFNFLYDEEEIYSEKDIIDDKHEKRRHRNS